MYVNACHEVAPQKRTTNPRNVAHFKYLVLAVTNSNYVNQEIIGRLNAENAYYHTVLILHWITNFSIFLAS